MIVDKFTPCFRHVYRFKSVDKTDFYISPYHVNWQYAKKKAQNTVLV